MGLGEIKAQHQDTVSAEIEGNFVIIKVPMQTPTPSKSAKTLVIATTHGNLRLPDVTFNGAPITIGVNVYIKPEERVVTPKKSR